MTSLHPQRQAPDKTTRTIGWTASTWAMLLFLALLPVGLLSAYTFRVTARSVRQQVRQSNEAAATLAAELVKDHFEESKRLASAIAAMPDVIDAVKRHDALAVTERLGAVVKKYPTVQRAYILDPGGILWGDYPRSPSSLGSIVPPYIMLAEARRPAISGVFLNDDWPRQLAVAFGAPVADEHGEIIGVVAFQYRLEGIMDWLKRANTRTREVLILDQNGTVTAHPRVDLQARRYREYASLDSVQRALKGEASVAEYQDPISGESTVAAFQPVRLEGGNWVVIAQQPVAAAYAPIDALRTQIATAAGVVGLAALTTALALGRSGNRIRRLGHAITDQNVRLSVERSQLRTLIDHLPDHIYIKDTEGRYLIDNVHHMRFVQCQSPEQVAGKTAYDFFPKELAERDTEDDRKVIESGNPLIEREEPDEGGADGTHWMSTTKVPVCDPSGTVVALVCVGRDVTERKREEDERSALLAREQAARAQAEAATAAERVANETLKNAQSQLVQTEKLRALGMVVAGVAHEINNPLAFVINNVAVLQRDVKAVERVLSLYREVDPALAAHSPEQSEKINELCEQIDLKYTLDNLHDIFLRTRDGLKRIQQIVRDLRDFVRLDTSDLSEVNINEGIESTVDIIRHRSKEKQVQVELELGKLPRLTCFPAKINQVVMNLLNNAIDASEPHSVVKVRTIPDEESGGVRIEVEDFGEGIDPAVRDRIFDPFFTTKPIGQGTGLGLSISYGIVRDHGGTIEVDSTPGKGSRFTVRLPPRATTT